MPTVGTFSAGSRLGRGDYIRMLRLRTTQKTFKRKLCAISSNYAASNDTRCVIFPQQILDDTLPSRAFGDVEPQ
jgi:hypothetical protein